MALMGATTLAGVTMAPFAGGTSLTASAAVSNAVIKIGGLVITAGTAEVVASMIAILGGVGITANVIKTIGKNYDVKISVGSSRVEFTRK